MTHGEWLDVEADPEADAPVEGGRRLSRSDRRVQVLDAALAVVAAHGFTGTTTDQVARAAGVSQPYVVRMFGTKADLLLALYERVTERVLDAFRAVPAGGPGEVAEERLGDAYARLISDRDLLRVMQHGFNDGDERVRARARRVLGEAARLFRERTGSGPEEALGFLATGMLINVLVSVDAWDHPEDVDLAPIAACLAGTQAASAPGSAR